MSPVAQGRLLSCLLILSVACCAVEGHGGSGGRTNNRGGNDEPPPDRTNAISQMPTNIQEELFKKILGDGNVQMNENASPAEITKTGKLPEVINSLANGAIDALVSQIPFIGPILAPLIKGGLGALFSSFGKKKVFIPNMPPVFICPPNIEILQERGKHSAVVNWQEPIGFDAEDGTITKVHRNGKKPGSRFNGEESIQYTVYDSRGRKDSCIMHVKVKNPIRSVWVSTTPLPTGLKTGSSSVFALVGSNITASSDLAMDGIKSENFFSGDCFLSNTGDLNPIWIVDLARAYHVYSVTILNRSHLSKTTVDVMQNNPLNGAAGTSTHCGKVTNESAGATSPVVCEYKTVRQNQTYVPVFPTGRYIRLQKAGEYLLLCEVTIHVVAEHRNEVKFRIPTDK